MYLNVKVNTSQLLKMSKYDCKISLLREIKLLKNELFGAYSAKITKNTKAEHWKKVHECAVTLNVVAEKKDFTYTRDTVWPNIRKRTMVSVVNLLRFKRSFVQLATTWLASKS